MTLLQFATEELTMLQEGVVACSKAGVYNTVRMTRLSGWSPPSNRSGLTFAVCNRKSHSAPGQPCGMRPGWTRSSSLQCTAHSHRTSRQTDSSSCSHLPKLLFSLPAGCNESFIRCKVTVSHQNGSTGTFQEGFRSCDDVPSICTAFQEYEAYKTRIIS